MTQNSPFTTSTTVAIADPNALRESMMQKLRDNDVEFQEDGPRAAATIPEFGLSIVFELRDEGLRIELGTVNLGHLHFMREEVIEHTAAIDEVAADAIRWDNAEATPDLPVNFHIFNVIDTQDVIQGLRRVTVEGPGAVAMQQGGIHVRIILPKTRGRAPVWPTIAPNGGTLWPQGEDQLHARVLSLRKVCAASGRLEFDVAVHDDGFVSDWALNAAIGSELGIMGPGGEVGDKSDGPHLFVGDRTAFAAIARNIDDLGETATGKIIAVCPVAAEAQTYFQHPGFDVVSYTEREFRGNSLDLVKPHVRASEFAFAWFGGEFQDAQDLRKFFKTELGLQKGKQLSVAYWRDGHEGEA